MSLLIIKTQLALIPIAIGSDEWLICNYFKTTLAIAIATVQVVICTDRAQADYDACIANEN